MYNRIECRNWKSFNIDSFRNDLSLSALCVPNVNLLDTAATMTSMYDVTLSDLLNRHAAMKTMLVRDRPSNLWFDDECRDAKIRVRALERLFQASDDLLDRAVWTGGLSLFTVSSIQRKPLLPCR